ncbi:MAG: GMC family oxidoreductase [Alphaproteobacteria bacterium]
MAEDIDADVVIVGSGIAGALAAYSLAKKGVKRIVVLEAGPRIERDKTVERFKTSAALDFSAGFPNEDWAPRPDWGNPGDDYIEQTGPAKIKTEYLRVVGGTTWHWSGSTPRFMPVDFRLRSTYGVGMDWPISYDDIEPYYTEAEEEIGVAGDSEDHGGSPRSKPYPLPPIPQSYCEKFIADGVKGIGIKFLTRPVARASKPYNGRPQCVGFGTCSPICPSGAQYAAILHVERAEKLGVKVLENTRVDRLVADGDVKYVEARKPDGTPVKVRAKIFIVAANGIETPRLLMMSVSEKFPKGIANSSGLVGRNYLEHPTLICRMIMPKPVYPGRGPETIVFSHSFRDGEFRKERSGWTMTVANRVHFHDIANDLISKGLEPPQLDAALKDRLTREVELDANLEQIPDEKNGITLNWDKRDRAGQPMMQHYYSFGAYEEAGFAHVRETFGRIEKTLGAEIVHSAGPVPVHHPMGMTRMGDNPRQSVTDKWGRSHDHKNLFLLSGGLFPSCGTVNPTLTIAALSLRAADEIARQLGGRQKG